LITVVLAASLGGVARAEGGGQASLSLDAGLMRSTALRLLDTKPIGVAGPGSAGLGAKPYAGLSDVWQYEGWVVGVTSAIALDFQGPTQVFLAGVTGFRVVWGNWKLQATAELGGHLLLQIGEGQFLNSSDENALLPFAGASIELGHANGVRPGRLGVSMFIRQDLEQHSLTATVVDHEEEDGTTFNYQADYAIGGTMIGLALNLTTN
jgi:hypothetical protein